MRMAPSAVHTLVVPLLLQHPKPDLLGCGRPGGARGATSIMRSAPHVRMWSTTSVTRSFRTTSPETGDLVTPDAGEEHAQVVHDLGACGDCGTRAA